MEDTDIALLVCSLLFVALILGLVFSSSGFKNLIYSFDLPVITGVPNLQLATLPIMSDISSEESTSSEEVTSSDEPCYETMLFGIYENEKRNMNPFGDYKLVSVIKKKEAKEIDNLLQRLENASNPKLRL